MQSDEAFIASAADIGVILGVISLLWMGASFTGVSWTPGSLEQQQNLGDTKWEWDRDG